jgi:hypothetical protein
MWVCGLRRGILYTIEERPVDPRLSNAKLQEVLAWCATGLDQGLTEERAFQAAEALVMRSMYHGIAWPSSTLTQDMASLIVFRE